MSNNTIHILNARREHVSEGELGEVYVTGKNVVAEYLTEEHDGSFVVLNGEREKQERLYRTGDWGIIRNNRLIYQGSF